MKKFLIIFCIILSAKTSAQTEKGTIMAGGQLALRTANNASNFRLNPNFGYFFRDNFAFGGNLNLDFSKQGTISSNTFGIGPFMRYYFGKSQAKPFAVVNANYLTQTVKTGSTSVNSSGFGFLFGLGFAAFLNRNVAVEGITGYDYSDYSNAKGAGGFSLSLGFQLYFNNDVVKDLKRTIVN
jgi:hypothetical protein